MNSIPSPISKPMIFGRGVSSPVNSQPEVKIGSATLAVDQSERSAAPAVQSEARAQATDLNDTGVMAGDNVNIALTFSSTVGAPKKMRARFVVKTVSGEKAQKLESFIGPDQAREVLVKLMRNDAPDLHSIVARFLADPPQK